MKKYLGVLLLLSMFSGCGKKKEKTVKNDLAYLNRGISGGNKQIDEYVFEENSNIDNFSFVEEDSQSKSRKNAYKSDEEINRELLREDLEGEELAFSNYDDDLNDLNFSKIQFEFDKDRLCKGQEEKLHRNIESARRAVENGNNVEVRAYGCEIGSAAYNLALSQKRANAIKKEMVAHDIGPKSIAAVGRGQEYQIAWSNATERSRRIKELAPNRRAEMSVSPSN